VSRSVRLKHLREGTALACCSSSSDGITSTVRISLMS
jgi:hypothetical protein